MARGGILRALLPLVTAAALSGLVAIGLVMLLRAGTGRDTAPAPEVRRVHDALHDMVLQCSARVDSRRLARIEQDVEVVLSYARSYPTSQLPIDDETGTSLSLLLATREDLRTCAPEAAAKVDRQLPRELRDREGGQSR